MKNIILTLIAFVLLTLNINAELLPTNVNQVVTSVTIAELTELLQDMKMEPQLSKDNDGDPSLEIMIDGKYHAVVICYLNKSGKIISLGFQSDYRMGGGYRGNLPSIEVLNEWNKNNRFTKVYRDDPEVRLESDFDIKFGTTWASISGWLLHCNDGTSKFVEHIKFKLK